MSTTALKSKSSPLNLKGYQWALTFVALFLMFANKLLPPIWGLTTLGMSVLCIFVGTMILLLFVALHWPFFVCVMAMISNGVFTLQASMNASVGNNIIWFIILSSMIIMVLSETGVIRRIALWFITRPICKKNPWWFVTMMWLGELLIGSIMDTVGTCMLFSSLTEECLNSVGCKKGSRTGELMVNATQILCGISYGITPIGHPVPALMVGMFSIYANINFFSYMVVGYIVGFIFLICLLLADRKSVV